MKTEMNHRRGLSRVEVLSIFGALVLLAVIASLILPAFARARTGRRGPSCTSNLKQIGLSYHLFANDHEGAFPFALSNRLGGSAEFRESHSVFLHYVSMSNELVTPKVLVCPVDVRAGTRTRAQDFLSPLSNSNVSYFVGLDAATNNPATILSGDWNISGATSSNGSLRWLTARVPAIWMSNVHQNVGNIGMADGSARQTSSQALQQQIQLSALPVMRLAVP